MNSQKVSIVIPVFNEIAFIGQCIADVMGANTLGAAKELVIVDDGSTDGTGARLKSLVSGRHQATTQATIRLILLPHNQGKGAAVKAGLIASTGDIVIIQDADLEYNPADYPKLLKPFFHYRADVVYGSRFISAQPRRTLLYWHSLANKALTTFSNMFTNINLTDMETGYKAFRGDLIRQIAPHLRSQRFGFEPEVTARLAKIKNIKIYEVGISYQGRPYNEGKKIRWTDGLRAIWEIIRYNLNP